MVCSETQYVDKRYDNQSVDHVNYVHDDQVNVYEWCNRDYLDNLLEGLTALLSLFVISFILQNEIYERHVAYEERTHHVENSVG